VSIPSGIRPDRPIGLSGLLLELVCGVGRYYFVDLSLPGDDVVDLLEEGLVVRVIDFVSLQLHGFEQVIPRLLRVFLEEEVDGCEVELQGGGVRVVSEPLERELVTEQE
jgi:hypothetical protein